MRRRALCLIAAGVLTFAVPACGWLGRGRSTPAPAEPGARRFPHRARAHAALACTACHAEADVAAARPARPGTADHAPCDRAGCHAEAFLRSPGALCDLCHVEVRPRASGATRAAAWPPASGARALAAEFSHRRHLDRARLDAAVGFHVACGDCHRRGESGAYPGLPGHAECARCHGGDAPRPARPRLAECRGCHVSRPVDPGRSHRLILGDLRFTHDRHEFDRGGKAIRCVDCHADVAEQRRTVEASVPATAVCVDCHDDLTRTPRPRRMGRCETCHDRDISRVRSFVAPRSHLRPRDRPDDHTLAFRHDHARQARDEARRCAGCHAGMSGSGHDNCAECHATTRPRDHSVAWREYDHGPEAATSTDRCTTCHDGEFCVACHARAPRSHTPRADFLARGHAAAARANGRSCAVCHGREGDLCLGCHHP